MVWEVLTCSSRFRFLFIRRNMTGASYVENVLQLTQLDDHPHIHFQQDIARPHNITSSKYLALNKKSIMITKVKTQI